eukprot:TRINITY_DN12104_c0_g1_i1.p1 TRINITY_DN12104_c0_g1~~TRINITY_DN12104_c0_g1_i1.p1  ORF type:complete len:516 (+),score=108.57 TRINITY_DN12104_c0_g1_i1:57-1550(+)
MEEVNFSSCAEIRDSRSMLESADWKSLKKGNFCGCFAKSGDGAEELLKALSTCIALEEVDFSSCTEIGANWYFLQWDRAFWKSLKKGNFKDCFAKSDKGAKELLEVLSRCTALEEVDFSSCTEIQNLWYTLNHDKADWKSFKKGTFKDCFAKNSDGGDGELLEFLSRCATLEEVDFSGCREMSSWSVLESTEWKTYADWKSLKKGNFKECFVKSGTGAKVLLTALSRCAALEEVDFSNCKEIGNSWSMLESADWKSFKKGTFQYCFPSSVSGDGARELLAALSRCATLEEVDFKGCEQIQDSWSMLESAEWKSLKKGNFWGCFARSGDGARELLTALSRCVTLEVVNFHYCRYIRNSWSMLESADWKSLRKGFFQECFAESGDGAKELLTALSRCVNLEVVNFEKCREIRNSWSMLQNAEWKSLKKGIFKNCFAESGDGGRELLTALSRCVALEEVEFGICSALGDDKWDVVGPGCWPQLKSAKGVPEPILQKVSHK